MTIEHPDRERKKDPDIELGDEEEVVAKYESGGNQHRVVDGEVEHYGEAVYVLKEVEDGKWKMEEILGTPQ